MHSFRREFHFDTRFAVRLQSVSENSPRLMEVGPGDAPAVPALLTSALERSEYVRFLGQQVPVTFVLDVPLSIIVKGAIAPFVEEMAFAESVQVSDLQYRAVGASFDEFSAEYSGRVHLQVSCALDAKS